MARYIKKDLINKYERETINDLSCLLHLKIVKNQNDKKVFSDLMKHFNFSNAEQ